MKKTLITLITLVSSVAFGQTKNYNTIMLKQQRDSISQEINLHMQKAKLFETTSMVLQGATALSSIITYHIFKNKENGEPMIFIPLGIGVTALATSLIAERHYRKAQEKRFKFICKF